MQGRETYADLLDKVISIDNSTISQLKKKLKAIHTDFLELLDKYTNEDNVIPTSKIRQIQREVDSLSERYADEVLAETGSAVETTIETVVGFMVLELGLQWISRPMWYDELLSRSKEIDGLSLLERSRIIGGDLSDKIRATVRRSVYRGDTVSQIFNNVRADIDSELWKVERLVTSELNNTARIQVGEVLSENGHEYVQFYESEVCTSRNHHRHNCHKMAHTDKYGKGIGVYKVTDFEIYFPHPQCRGYIGMYVPEGSDS